MNALSAKLLEVAWSQLEAKKRSLAGLKVEVESCWYIWRNNEIDNWVLALAPLMKRPATDYYPDAELGDRLLDWIYEQGYHGWETPLCDGEDDDFVCHFVVHCAAVMAWTVFEELWPHLDYSDEEIEQFFNLKNAYAPPPPKKGKKGNGAQIRMF